MDYAQIARSADLILGALTARLDGQGRVVPCRFTAAQVRELGGMAAWHPRLYREMATCTAGVRLEFETDSAHLAFEARMDPFPSGSQAMIDDMLDANPGVRPPYDGFWYFSRPFVEYKTTSIMVNKNALPKETAKRLGLK